MRPIRVFGTTAVLLLVGGLLAGPAQAQGHDQKDKQEQQKGKKDQHQAQQQAKQAQHQAQQQVKQEQHQAQQQVKQDQHQVQQQTRQAQLHVQQANQQTRQAQQQVVWQQNRINEQRQRDAAYRAALARQVQAAQQRTAQLQQQRRNAQYAAQQQYLANLRLQQQRLQATRDYTRDPGYSARPIYRYNRAGTYYETNQYGADVLRQAVNYGYQQGFQFGQADRRDGWRSDYQNSYAYQDANYGFDGRYVAQGDYNYYFRQGFQRGYQDGYGTRQQYGTVSNGSPSILSNVLSTILGLVSIK